MEEIFVYNIQIEIIKEHHLLSFFHSSDRDLELFLKEDALYHQKQNISITFLWFYKKELVSYMSLLTDRITLHGNLTSFFKNKGIYYTSLPALKIGRLCVDDRFQRRGLGTLMVHDAISIAKKIKDNYAGCRFLTVDAKENAVLFYKNLGFVLLKNQIRNTTPMLFDLQSNLHG